MANDGAADRVIIEAFRCLKNIHQAKLLHGAGICVEWSKRLGWEAASRRGFYGRLSGQVT